MAGVDFGDRVRGGMRELDRERPAGRVIGRYILEEVLGEGAAAVVHRARDRELGRIVAIKVLREPVGGDASTRERFLREAQVAASLSHPHIVAVHDVGEWEGRPYLVMELVDGLSLAHVLQGQGEDRRRLLRLMSKVADGVAAAHARGIVHRDLKPANILVTKLGEPKVGDFGLARILGADAGLTRSGAILGTPLYMAPEQVRGRTRDITPATDVHALGVILYEILTGRPPHPGESISEVFSRIVQDEPIAPRRMDPSVPRDLETIVLKCLEKDPGRRYADAREFGDDLRRHLDGEPIVAQPPGPAARSAKWVRRHRVGLGAASMALVAAAAWAGVDAIRRREFARTEDRRREVERLLEAGRPALDRAAQYLYREEAETDELLRRVAAGQALIQKAVDLQPDQAVGHHLLGCAWELQGRIEEAEAAWRRSIALDPGFGPAHFRLGRLLFERAQLLMSVQHDATRPEHRPLMEPDASPRRRLAEEGARELEIALKLENGTDDEVQRGIAEAMSAYVREDGDTALRVVRDGLSRFQGRDGFEEFLCLAGHMSADAGEKEALFDRAIRIRPKFALARLGRANLNSARGRLDAAIEDYSVALSHRPRLIQAWVGRAHARMKNRDFDGAVADCDEALRIDPEDSTAILNRASALGNKGDWDAALAGFDRALQLDPRMLVARLNRANVFQARGDLRGAVEEYGRAIEADPSYAVAHLGRGNLRMLLQESEGALADFDEAIRLNASLDVAWLNRGLLRLRTGDRDRALPDLNEAIRLRPDLPTARAARGQLRAQAGDYRSALADLEEVLRIAPPGWPDRAGVERMAAEIRLLAAPDDGSR